MFSVITVCRNAATTLAITAESITRQSFRDFEWIVIDGASSDQTLATLQPFRDRITHLISEPDLGIYDAMNKGLFLARGRYLHFLNADDAYADDQVLGRMASTISAHDREIVYGNVILWNPTSGIRNRVGRAFQHRDAARCVLPHHQAVFMRREWVLGHGGFDTRFGLSADIELIGQALKGLDHAQWVDTDVAIFRHGGASEGIAFSLVHLRDRTRAISSAFGGSMAWRYFFFLGYFLPKVFFLHLTQGTKWDLAWREKRMRQQALTRNGTF